jgi:putative membrane protein
MTGYHDMMWGYMWIFWIVVAVVVVYLVKALYDRSGSSATESPLDILKKRYAKGEITKEVFEQMKQNLSER